MQTNKSGCFFSEHSVFLFIIIMADVTRRSRLAH